MQNFKNDYPLCYKSIPYSHHKLYNKPNRVKTKIIQKCLTAFRQLWTDKGQPQEGNSMYTLGPLEVQLKQSPSIK